MTVWDALFWGGVGGDLAGCLEVVGDFDLCWKKGWWALKYGICGSFSVWQLFLCVSHTFETCVANYEQSVTNYGDPVSPTINPMSLTSEHNVNDLWAQCYWPLSPMSLTSQSNANKYVSSVTNCECSVHGFMWTNLSAGKYLQLIFFLLG